MPWTTPADLKAQLQRLWQRGDLPRWVVTADASAFPLRLPIKGPSPSELADQFEAVRTWAGQLQATRAIRLDWREVRHRVHGQQSLPTQAWIDSIDAALAWIHLERHATRLRQLAADTRAALPAVLPWIERRPLQALELAEDWPRLLAVVAWVMRHPRPGIHLRQVDLPGVHSKFMESHRGVLAELLDLALPASAVQPEATGASRFAARYGFAEKPDRIRLRALDSTIALIPGLPLADITLDATSFSQLAPAAQRVFITENETNFLAFPPAPGAIVIFGAGYGWEALARATWLHRLPLHYWGDIDTHGFAILHQLRAHFPHAQSLLMDHATLMAHQPLWGVEDKPVTADLPRLTAEEQALYDTLRDNRIRPGLRLEQERVGYAWVRAAVAGAL